MVFATNAPPSLKGKEDGMSSILAICVTEEKSGMTFSLIRDKEEYNDFDHLLVGGTMLEITSYVKKWRSFGHKHRFQKIDFLTAYTGELEVGIDELRKQAESEGWTFLDEKMTVEKFPEFMKALATDTD